VSLVMQKTKSAQKTATKYLANSLYDENGDSSKYLTGLKSTCSESAGVPYGNIEEEDLMAQDGTYPWEGKTTATVEAIALNVVRALMSSAKLYDGPEGKPNIATTTEDLFNSIKGILTPMQRFTEDQKVTKAGFTNLVFEGMMIVADDYCPSGYMFALNTAHIGFAIHKSFYFARENWHRLNGPMGKTMKILWDGNLVCNNRKAHAAHSNLST